MFIVSEQWKEFMKQEETEAGTQVSIAWVQLVIL
jgi:hypothetical protein